MSSWVEVEEASDIKFLIKCIFGTLLLFPVGFPPEDTQDENEVFCVSDISL